MAECACSDAHTGRLTCINVVDYAIASPFVCPIICDFYVSEFDECLSDIHCPVAVNIGNVPGIHEPAHTDTHYTS